MSVDINVEEVLKQYAAGKRDFSAVNFSEANLSGVNLSKANFSGANLSVANLCSSNLSETDFSRAKLNVAKLSGANLSKANLSEANLNVANLTLVDLSHAELRRASLVRAEMARAELSGANLSHANLSSSDMKDAKLRNANLSHANLSRADLKWTTFIAANLAYANLHGSDLSSANLSGADLSNTELRQANLSRANLRGANLSGANLRWADLSGADLSWADLSGARLSGANLTGVNLSCANLLGTILVHADLTRASLIGVDWSGADLSGATLTGAKLHGVLRFGIKTDGILCEWVDLSPHGDQSKIYYLTTARLKGFFHETPPTVRVTIDATFDQEAHHALTMAYYQLVRQYQIPFPPPNIRIGRRRTTLSFEMRRDEQLFLASFVAILPFRDADRAQANLLSLIDMLQSADWEKAGGQANFGAEFTEKLQAVSAKVNEIKLLETAQQVLGKVKFFHSPTQTTLVSSNNQTLTLYRHPGFGKRLIQSSESMDPLISGYSKAQESSLPPLGVLVEFIQSFQELGPFPPVTGNTDPV